MTLGRLRLSPARGLLPRHPPAPARRFASRAPAATRQAGVTELARYAAWLRTATAAERAWLPRDIAAPGAPRARAVLASLYTAYAQGLRASRLACELHLVAAAPPPPNAAAREMAMVGDFLRSGALLGEPACVVAEYEFVAAQAAEARANGEVRAAKLRNALKRVKVLVATRADASLIVGRDHEAHGRFEKAIACLLWAGRIQKHADPNRFRLEVKPHMEAELKRLKELAKKDEAERKAKKQLLKEAAIKENIPGEPSI